MPKKRNYDGSIYEERGSYRIQIRLPVEKQIAYPSLTLFCYYWRAPIGIKSISNTL